MEAGVDKVEFQAPGDRILGAGVNEREALFFSNNHGMVCMKTQKIFRATNGPVNIWVNFRTNFYPWG